MYEFIKTNWVNLCLILVGTFALLVYWLQERKRETNAASLVLVQIDELQDRIREIQSYITNNQLNDTAFYESRTLFTEDYWDRYKHYFVRRMDSRSYQTISSLYACAAEIQEQQQLMKNLQKNFFFVKQQVIANMESNYILSGLNNMSSFPVDIQQVIGGLVNTMPKNIGEEQRSAIENMLHQIGLANENADLSAFWQAYNQKRTEIRSIMDQSGLTAYTPVQIRLSLEHALDQYRLLEVVGSEGYRTLQKIARRKT